MDEPELKANEGQEWEEGEDAVEVVADAASEEADAAVEVVDTEPATVDLNVATEEELQQLPGVGAVLAARIVDYRTQVGPFGEPAAVMAVPGVSEATYTRLEDRLSASPVELQVSSEPDQALAEVEVLEESPETTTLPEEAETLVELEPEVSEAEGMEQDEPEGVPVLVREPLEGETEMAEERELEPDSERVVEGPPPGPEPPLVEVVQARYGCARLLLVGLLSTILGAALALLLLFLVNGSLDFQSAAIRAAQDEVLRMEGVVGALDMKVADLEERMSAIQELEARLSDTQAALGDLSADLGDLKRTFELLTETQDALRQEFTNMREDMDGLAVQVSVLDRRLSDLETQAVLLDQKIQTLGESVRRFDAFLRGLDALLNETQGDLPPTPELRITPVPTPTAWETPTLRPQVTVIPLATSTPPLP